MRRQAHALQPRHRPAQPRRRDARAEPVLGLVPRAGAAARRGARRGGHARGDRLRPGSRGAARRGDAAHQAHRAQQPQQPDGRRLLAPGPRGGRAAGRRARPLGGRRRVLRVAHVRGAPRVHRVARPGHQGAHARRQHLLEGVRDDGLAHRLRRRPARADPRDDRHPEPGHLESIVDRAVGGRRGAVGPAGRGRQDGRRVRPPAPADHRRAQRAARRVVRDAEGRVLRLRQRLRTLRPDVGAGRHTRDAEGLD